MNGILKQEFIMGITTTDLNLMNKLISQSIKIYNAERPHWSYWMKTPDTMHKQKQNKIRTHKNKVEMRARSHVY